MDSQDVDFSLCFQFWLQLQSILKTITNGKWHFDEIFCWKRAETPFHNYYKKNTKALKENSTINVRSQGRLQRHNKRGETKGTEIKRFILRREGGASLNQGGVRATPWSKPLAWKTLHKLWMCIVYYVRCTWVPRCNAPSQSDVVNVYSIVGIRSLWKKPTRATRRICSDSFVKSWSQRCKKVDDCMR